MFPFLIGTVRTIKTKQLKAAKLGFPFLIGTVRTVYVVPSMEGWVERFPFLIGTVRTEAKRIYRKLPEWGFHSS